MDARFVNPFIASVKRVFKTMVSTDITVGRLQIIKSDCEPPVDVSAIIGLSGDAVGCAILSMSLDTAIRVASKFANVEMDKDHPDFSDALGELANMVAGRAVVGLRKGHGHDREPLVVGWTVLTGPGAGHTMGVMRAIIRPCR